MVGFLFAHDLIQKPVPPFRDHALKPPARKNPLEHAVTAKYIMIKPDQHVQADQPQHREIRQKPMHVAGLAPTGCAGRQKLGQFEAEHHDRHAAPGRITGVLRPICGMVQAKVNCPISKATISQCRLLAVPV